MSSIDGPILILDDDKDLTTMMRRYLEHEGFRVVVVNDPQVAIERCFEERPALLLVDLMMPRVNGEQFVAAIQRVMKETRPPICLVSASHAREEVAARLGLRESIGKPFALAELKATALRLTGKQKSAA